MDTPEANTIVREDAVQTAFAEIEATSQEQAAAIPNLDDGRDGPNGADGQMVGPDAGDVVPSGHAAMPSDANPAGNAVGLPPADPASADTPGKRKPRFKIGQKSAEESVTQYQPADVVGTAPETSVAAQPVAPLAKRAWRTFDRGLDAVNRPFEWLGDSARSLLGYVALVTLAVAILAMALMPLLFPHRDAIRFLQERRAESFTASASPGVAGEDAASHGEARRHATENE